MVASSLHRFIRPAILLGGCFTLLLAGLVTRASAQLVLHMDTANQQLWFTGSDSGSPDFIVENGGIQYYQVIWGDLSINLSESVQTLDLTSAISSTGNSTQLLGLGLAIDFASHASVNFHLVGAWDGDPGTTSLNGLNTNLDYSGLSNGNRTLLESFAGQSIPVVAGTNFNAVSAQTSAVPEPSTYAMIFGACAIGFAAWSRRHRAPVAG